MQTLLNQSAYISFYRSYFNITWVFIAFICKRAIQTISRLLKLCNGDVIHSFNFESAETTLFSYQKSAWSNNISLSLRCYFDSCHERSVNVEIFLAKRFLSFLHFLEIISKLIKTLKTKEVLLSKIWSFL